MALERFYYFFRTGRDGRRTAYKVGRHARDMRDIMPAEQDNMEIPREPRAHSDNGTEEG